MQNRRQFLTSLAALAAASRLQADDSSSPQAELALPTPAQRAWQDLEIGILISWGAKYLAG